MTDHEVKPGQSASTGAMETFSWDPEDTSALYSEEERRQLEKMYDSTLHVITRNEIIEGTVVTVTDKDVVLNVGFKSDGLVPLAEFRDEPGLKQGDKVEVYVVDEEDKNGQLILSRKNARLIRAWEAIVRAHHQNEILQGRVICKTKGGLVVDVYGFETFLPGSQIDVKPITDYDYYVGKTMEFKVVKINEAIKNAVVSHKALIESELEVQRQHIISKLEKGQVLEGTVKNITDFGAFIDLGGVDGLLYLSDISWGRIGHPSEILKLNQTVNVVVLDYDDEKKRISLGLKQLQPHPWEVLSADFQPGKKVKGKVVNIEDYGAFLEIHPGVEGLVHVSEISWGLQSVSPREYFKIGEEHNAVIVTLNREERKMSLSIRQLTNDPWGNIESKYPEGSRHTGKVINLTSYGAFVELENGIGGLVHISDFSWTRRINHPSEITKVGETLEVMILKTDRDARRLSLGYKQLTEDPWTTFETVFPLGSLHKGTIIRLTEKDAIVQLPYGVEAYCHIKELDKQDGSTAAMDETLDFRVIEFDREKKRIAVSHALSYKEYTPKPEDTAGAPVQKAKESKGTAAKKSSSEKDTLGDLGILSKLKENFKAEPPAEKVVPPETVAETTAAPEEAVQQEDEGKDKKSKKAAGDKKASKKAPAKKPSAKK